MNDSLEREIIIWLSGLISTDGNVRHSLKSSKTVQYTIASVENEWLELIKNKLEKIGIPSTIVGRKRIENGRLERSFYPRQYNSYQIYLNKPRTITFLFEKYDCQKWFNPRKWKVIEEAIIFYKNKAFNNLPYSLEEEQTIIENNKKEIKIIRDIINMEKPKWLKRSYSSVRLQYEKLREEGKIKRFCQFCGNSIPKEKMGRGKYCSLKCCYKIRNLRMKEYKLKWQKERRKMIKLSE